MTPGAPSSRHLLRVWLTLSVQSFGGGTATLALIRRAAVEEQRWVSGEEFGRFWGLVQLAPGINLLALTVLLGRRAAGGRGIVLALTGLLLPSAALTILLTAVYAHVRHFALVQEALRGIVPAVAGLGFLTAWQIARPLLTYPARPAILLGSALAAWLGTVPVLAILLVGALFGAAAENRRRP
jgi:chromate transporter